MEQGERDLSFEEIDQGFNDLLKEYGPPHQTSVKYPFWYLQKDGVWVVEDAANLPRRSGEKEPLVSAMRERNTHGRFPDEIWTTLRANPELRYDIARIMLGKRFPGTLHQDILAAVGLDPQSTYSSEQRKRDSGFRDAVLEKYDHRCAVCGFDLVINDKPIGLEAAHIRWHQYSGPDVVQNGIALCTFHHKMLDKGAVHITVEPRLLVAEDVHGSSPHIERLRGRHGQEINAPGNAEYALEEDVDWHAHEVFRGEYDTT